MTYEIRRISISDYYYQARAAQLAELAKKVTLLGGGGVGWSAQAIQATPNSLVRMQRWFEHRMADENAAVFVAIEEVQPTQVRPIIGHVQLLWRDPFVSATATHRAEVTKLFVDPDKRRTGLARDLMRALIRFAGMTGLTQLILDVRLAPTQTAALKLYESLGFKQFGELSRYARVDGKWYDGAYMVLDL